MKAMILAAGYGERLRPLTETTPKPLLQVGGKPLIQYHIENLCRAGIRDIVINTSWLGEQIEAYLGDGSRFGVELYWSREHEPLETGGGIRRALPLLGCDPFLLINGDVWSDFPLENLVARSWHPDTEAHLVLIPNPPFKETGDFTLCERGLVHYPSATDKTYTFSGISVMRPEIFALYPSASERFPLRNAIRSSISAGAVSGEVYDGTWWDVGTLDRLEMLNQILAGKPLDISKKPRLRASLA